MAHTRRNPQPLAFVREAELLRLDPGVPRFDIEAAAGVCGLPSVSRLARLLTRRGVVAGSLR